MPRINKIIELLESKQPAYYTGTGEFTYENGKRLSQTYVDYIRLNTEHGPFDLAGIDAFMRGLIDGGPTRSGHRTPAVIAELPTDGTDETTVRCNAWMIKQLLALGVHGLILCHAESPGAVRVFVESARFPFHSIGVGEKLGQGRRGHGGEEKASKMWGISKEEYLEKADVWPLNPGGELLLGIKMENKRAFLNAEKTVLVPGIAFGEWGLRDMSMSFGYRKKPEFPLPEELEEVRTKIWNACKKAGLFFLGIVTPDTVTDMIDRGLMLCRPTEERAAEIGRKHTG